MSSSLTPTSSADPGAHTSPQVHRKCTRRHEKHMYKARTLRTSRPPVGSTVCRKVERLERAKKFALLMFCLLLEDKQRRPSFKEHLDSGRSGVTWERRGCNLTYKLVFSFFFLLLLRKINQHGAPFPLRLSPTFNMLSSTSGIIRGHLL